MPRRPRQGLSRVARKAAAPGPARRGGDFRSPRKPAGPQRCGRGLPSESPPAAQTPITHKPAGKILKVFGKGLKMLKISNLNLSRPSLTPALLPNAAAILFFCNNLSFFNLLTAALRRPI